MSVSEVLCVCEPPKSGVPRYAAQIAAKLEGSGFHFTVACPKSSIAHEMLAGTDVDIVDIDMHPLNAMSAVRAGIQLWRLLRRKRFDLVHLHSSKAGLLGRPLCKLFRLPTVFTPNCFSFESVRHSKTKFNGYLSAERILGHMTERLVCVSEEERETAKRYGIVSDDHISIIPCFGDATRWVPRAPPMALRAELGIPLGAQVVGTVSRFHPQKAPKDFIAMAAALLRNCPETHFVFVGEDGPLRVEAEQYVEDLRLRDRVTLRTWTDNLCEFVALMDVVVLNSLWEGLPLSLVEAMLMEKPIVATDIPGSRELINGSGCGRLVPVSQPEAMATAVQELLESPDLMATLGKRGRLKVLSDYTVEQAARKTADLYTELLLSNVSEATLTTC